MRYHLLIASLLSSCPVLAAPLTTEEQLIEATASGNATIELAAGTFRLSRPLDLKPSN